MINRFPGIILICFLIACTSADHQQAPSADHQKSPGENTINICMQNPDLAGFIPFDMRSYNDSQIYELLYNTLITANYLGNLCPEIAERWTIRGSEYKFKIRENILFHNGRTLTTDDILFTLKQLAIHTHQQYKEIYTIEGVEDFISGKNPEISGLIKVDDFNFIVKLNKPFNYFLHFLSAKFTSIVPDNYAGLGQDGFKKAPIGTGPFEYRGAEEKVVKHRKFIEFRFSKNRNYFGKSGNADQINLFIPSEREKFKTLIFFDIFLEDPVFDRKKIDDLPHFKIINTPPEIIAFLALNPAGNSLLKDPEIRKLVNHLIDREKLLKILSLGNHIPAHTMIPPSLLGYNPYYRIGYGKASDSQLLLKGKNLSFTLLVYAPQVRVAECLKKELKAGNIDVDIKILPDKAYFKAILENPATSLIVEGITDYPTSYSFLNQLYESGGILNYFNIQSPEIKRLIEILPEIDIKKQTQTLVEINRLIEEQSIYIPLYYYSNNFVVKDRIKKIIFKYGGVIDFSALEVNHE
jgi:ABC-type transport system substrate-binding protein